METDQAQHRFAAVFMIFSLFAGFFMSLPALKSTWNKGLPASGVYNGETTKSYDQNFARAHLLAAPSKNFWGRMEYGLFHEGRHGVVIGSQGQLFTAEEFTVSRDRDALLRQNLSAISDVATTLADDNVGLVIALVPAKARMLAADIYPAANASLYDDVLAHFSAQGLNAPDLRTALSAPESYLKTDTHWSPEGTRGVAEILSAAIPKRLTHKGFQTRKADTIDHQGDLTRYIPGQKVHESVATYETFVPGASTNSNSLFGDETIDTVLIGTSYSANPLWHFEGHLKSALQSEVLNLADEGQGPFSVMLNWLGSDAYKSDKPKLVIWEIPERYMVLSEAKKEDTR